MFLFTFCLALYKKWAFPRSGACNLSAAAKHHSFGTRRPRPALRNSWVLKSGIWLQMNSRKETMLQNRYIHVSLIHLILLWDFKNYKREWSHSSFPFWNLQVRHACVVPESAQPLAALVNKVQAEITVRPLWLWKSSLWDQQMFFLCCNLQISIFRC